MGEYLPFLFAIAYVIYGFYNNLKKAQEEAKTRNPAKPWDAGQSPEKEESPWEREVTPQPVWPSYTEPEPILVKEVQRPGSYEPKYESVYQQPVYQQPVYEGYVKPKSARKKKSTIPTSVNISDGINQQGGAGKVYEFDMRDAVIKKAILDRPQY